MVVVADAMFATKMGQLLDQNKINCIKLRATMSAVCCSVVSAEVKMIHNIGAAIERCVLDLFRSCHIDTSDKEIVAFKLSAQWCKVCRKLTQFLATADAMRDLENVVVSDVDIDADERAISCFAESNYINADHYSLPAFIVFNRTGEYLGLFRDSSDLSALIRRVSESAKTFGRIMELKAQVTKNPLDGKARMELIDQLLKRSMYKRAEDEYCSYVISERKAARKKSVEPHRGFMETQIFQYYKSFGMRKETREFEHRMGVLDGRIK